jgi:hypothetical protein
MNSAVVFSEIFFDLLLNAPLINITTQLLFARIKRLISWEQDNINIEKLKFNFK